MDTDSMYMSISGEFNKIVELELRSQYDHCRKAKFSLTSKYHDRTPGLFKAEFQGTSMIALISKCYHTEDGESCPKISCKGLSNYEAKPYVMGLIFRDT